jgi:subtilisin family serine protease
MKRTIFVSFIVLLAGLLLSPAAAATAPIKEKHVPNEIIIKFRGKDDSGTSQTLLKLNARYKVREIKPLFKNFEEQKRHLTALQQKNPASLTKEEKHILKRLYRAAKNERVPELKRIYKLKLDLDKNQTLQEVAAAYAASPDVEYTELNYIVSITLSPNDPLYSLQWPLNNTGQDYPASGRFNPPPGTPGSDINAPEAWDIHTGSSNIIVAVLDTGVDYNHRDLQNNIWVNEAELNGIPGVDDDNNGYIDDIYGYDFINGDPEPLDDYGHGTHCAGIIAAKGNNGLDIAGVCWNCRIMALKFLDSSGSGTIEDAVKAFYYAVQNGADIISNSWGGFGYSQALEDAINYAHSQGVTIIASAGNDDLDFPFYPAYYDNVISVAATNSNDEKATFSNYGSWVDIAAPGVDILSLRAAGTSLGSIYDDYTTVASGTSMSCPHVAGACALLLSANPLLKSDEVYDILMKTVDPIAEGICLSNGRLDLSRAINLVSSSKGRIAFDSNYYSCCSVVSVSLVDKDLKGHGTQTVILTTNGGDSETVLLTEIVSAAGVFKGTISTSPGDANIEDGTLQVGHGQIITAVYEDANDGTGAPATVVDTAIVDCKAPNIFNIRTGVPGREPTIRFETDEPTTAHVLCGLACGGPYIIEGNDSNLATIHAIKLTAVSPQTDYFYIVKADDAAGNETADTNMGRCYSFTTTAPPGKIYVPDQCPTIQEAIDNSWEGGMVIVADGIYTGSGNRDIDFRGRFVTVKSKNGPQNCIIDCNGSETESHRGFYFHWGEDANSVLAGFTITNGYIAGSWYVGIGGAILCTNNSSPAITNCILKGNSAGWDGGGINNLSSSPTITNCTFISNSAIGNDGGGINNEISNPLIVNCSFIGNSAYDWGGAIRNIFNCNPTITNCAFIGNSSDDGGGMFYYYQSSPIITGCTFSGNLARNGNALACGVDSLSLPSDVQIANCILADGGIEIQNFDNSVITITYSDVMGGWPGSSNINADPHFVGPGYWDANGTWVDGDYHLLPNSPCINTGDPNYVPEPNETDLDGLPRVIGGRIDMGAYEFNHQPVAVAGPNQTVYAWIDGADVNLDGSASYDDDNDVLDYYWSWTIGGDTYKANGVRPTIKLPVGIHTIELVVNDGIDLSEPAYCTITVIKAVRGRLIITPRVIETRCFGKWIIATLFILPVPGEKVNTTVPLRLYPSGIEAKYQHFYRYGRFSFSPTFALAFFDKKQVIDALGPGRFEVSVVGEFLSGRYFFGSDFIRIVSPPPPPPHYRH